MSFRRRTASLALAAAIAAVLATLIATLGPRVAVAAPGIDQLSSQLGHEQTRQEGLSAGLASLSRVIASLQGQISLVQSREAAVRTELAGDRAALAHVQDSLGVQRRRLVMLRARLAHARMLLSRQLVSSYEAARPDLVAVVVQSRGFADLLERVGFLHDAERQQGMAISSTREAKAQADGAARRLAKLEADDRQLSEGAALRVRALAGMNGLLQSRQAALGQAQAAQQTALQSSRARGGRLQAAISRLKAQQAAIERAAQQAAAQQAATQQAAAQQAPTQQSSRQQAGPGPGAALGPSGGWAIPYAIVLCESGGQNLPPNSAGASGYYQIIPGTWKLYGGSGPAAYLTGKAEQDAVAARIWNGGAGASNWVCAGIVGIH
ncbi:MAG: coiled-coil domain-containing protein [Solirubrobacteraceae bacterium]